MTKDVTGTKSQVLAALEAFVRTEVTDEKPRMNHLFMVVEHSCSAMIEDKDATYEVSFSVDLESLAISFIASKVTL